MAVGGAVAGLVLVLHGGRSRSTVPTSPVQLSVLRVAAIVPPVRRALQGTGIIVDRPRFTVRGWNGCQASPVADVTRWLDEAATRFGPIPVALIGHSMGARAAIRAAGHPLVRAVAGLAPWLPFGEPVTHLGGTLVLLAHGDRDRVTSPAETWDFAARAREITSVTTVRVHGGDHAMLRGMSRWHRLAAEFARAALDPPAA
jgi:pimeloyl-ACP methyl ester carboxylesterase